MPTKDPAFQTRSFLKPPDVERFLDLAPGSWVKPLHGSPLLRPRRRGLVRNAAIVAGNHRNQAAIPHLTELLLHDPEHLVRGHAAWELGRIGGTNARRALRKAKQSETDPFTSTEIEAALEQF